MINSDFIFVDFQYTGRLAFQSETYCHLCSQIFAGYSAKHFDTPLDSLAFQSTLQTILSFVLLLQKDASLVCKSLVNLLLPID